MSTLVDAPEHLPVSADLPDAPYRYRHGNFAVAFAFDPSIPETPRRFKLMVYTYRWMHRLLASVSLRSYLITICALTVLAAWSAFYVEMFALIAIVAGLACVGVYLSKTARRSRHTRRFVGVAFTVFACLLYCGLWLSRWVPYTARGFAVAYVQRNGGDLSYEEVSMVFNQTSKHVLGRSLIIGDIFHVRGPIEAFPPRVVDDLNVLPSVAIGVTSFEVGEATNIAAHVQAIATHIPSLDVSQLNNPTLETLSRSGLTAYQLNFEDSLSDSQVQLLVSPLESSNNYRFHNFGPEQWAKLKPLLGTAKWNKPIYMSNCTFDLESARLLSHLGGKILLDVSSLPPEQQLPLDQLDAIVDSQIQIVQLTCGSVGGEQAARIARIGGLQEFIGTLNDDAAVAAMQSSPVDRVWLATLTSNAAASLKNYPSLQFVFADQCSLTPRELMPLLSIQSIDYVGVNRYLCSPRHEAWARASGKFQPKHIKRTQSN